MLCTPVISTAPRRLTYIQPCSRDHTAARPCESKVINLQYCAATESFPAALLWMQSGTSPGAEINPHVPATVTDSAALGSPGGVAAFSGTCAKLKGVTRSVAHAMAASRIIPLRWGS